jgi:hypothetical protein
LRESWHRTFDVLWLLEELGGVESLVGIREALAIRDLAVPHGVEL